MVYLIVGGIVFILIMVAANVSRNSPSKLRTGRANQEALPKNKIIHPSESKLDAVPETFVVFDVETTGLHAFEHEIIEIAAIKAHTNQIGQETYSALVKTKKPIPKKITELTGITNEMVEKDGIPLENALEEFRKFIGKEKLVAYNKDFDKTFINVAAEKLGKKPIVKHVTCAYKKARAAWYGLKSYKLGDVARMLGISEDGNHRALGDCKRTLIIYVNAAQIVKDAFRGSKKVVAVILMGIALSGCATHMANIHPEWNPPNGFEEADAKCRASAVVPHCYTCALDVKYYYGCMGSYGYILQRGRKPTEELEKPS